METPTRVEVEGGRLVRLTWPDGAVHELAAARLRDSCSCADCVARRERPGLRLVASEPTIDDARLVGDYGISFVFGPDGHRTGIFRWDQLEELGRSASG